MRIVVLIIFFGLFSCKPVVKSDSFYRKDFNIEEKKALIAADSILYKAGLCTLITLDKNNQPRARVVEPFAPKNEYIIWMATNPKSRKVAQLKNNSKTALHYFDKDKIGYVSLMGNTTLVNNDSIKNAIWKEGWEKFYPNRDEDYILLKFIPETLELISVVDGFTGDEVTWKPTQIVLRKFE